MIDTINRGENRLVTITPKAIDQLQSYHFPGNIRELENILERAATLCENNVIEERDLALQSISKNQEQVSPSSPPDTGQHSPLFNYDETLDEYLESIEKDIIIDALEKNRWNRTNTAKSLGISFRSLRYRLKKLGLDDQ